MPKARVALRAARPVAAAPLSARVLARSSAGVRMALCADGDDGRFVLGSVCAGVLLHRAAPEAQVAVLTPAAIAAAALPLDIAAC